ncbi:MAG: uroporphyrinogen decarboxylase family protein [Melioribacteraceae bacterium]|nr:uroporphyrinogen decarboxylase family protein [Melioribacteraceae bacterium]
MNGYERIKAALNGEKPDKTPIMLHNFMMAAKEFGVTMEQYRNDPKIIANCFIDSVERYKFDGVLIDIDTVTLAGAVTVPIDFPVDEPARSNKGSIQSMDDVKNLKLVKVEDYKYIQIWLEAVRLLKEYFKDEIYVRGNCDQAPFSLASMMRNAQNWMLDLMMAEENQIFELLEYAADTSSQFIKLMAQTGVDMVSNGDSPAGPEMISPEMYEKFALPYEKKMADTAHEFGLPYGLHICGDTESILSSMLKTGADMIELDYKADVKKIYEIYHDKVTLFGNIDPSGVLALGTPELVRQKTIELLEIYSGSNRFVLNSGCALPAITPSENIKVMIKTAREFYK